MANFSIRLQNAWLDAYESILGAAAILQLRSGPPAASCASAAVGTLLVTITLPSDWMAAASGGSKAKSGTWSATASGTGTIGHYRYWDAALANCDDEGTVSQAFSLTTSAGTTAPSNVLTFASTAGVTEGMSVDATGIASDTTVAGVTSTTVTLSKAVTSNISSGATIFIGDTSGDMKMGVIATTASATVITVDLNTLIGPSV